jgi:hypothetical protein
MSTAKSSARSVADLSEGTIVACVDIAAPPERVFRALTTEEVTNWWGSAEMYRTTRFEIDLRVVGTATPHPTDPSLECLDMPDLDGELAARRFGLVLEESVGAFPFEELVRVGADDSRAGLSRYVAIAP